MPFAYSPEYRAGRLAYELAAELEVCEATIHRWKAQDAIDRGERLGLSSNESAELQAARSRIAELETELAATKRAAELFGEGRVVRPKALYPIVAQLGAEGHSTKGVCRLLSIAPTGFFYWRTAPPSPRGVRRAWLTDLITQIWEESRQTYRARRIRAELDDAHSQVVNHKLVRSIMRAQGAGCSAAQCLMPGRGGSLAGRSAKGPRQRWSTRRLEWPSSTEAPADLFTPTTDRSSPRGPSRERPQLWFDPIDLKRRRLPVNRSIWVASSDLLSNLLR